MVFFEEEIYLEYVINLDNENSKKETRTHTHWVSLFTHSIECITLGVLSKTRDKWITHNILRKWNNESIMYRFYCIAFIEYTLARKKLLNYTNLFSQNDEVICNVFKDKYCRSSNSWVYIKKNWWNKKLIFKANKSNQYKFHSWKSSSQVILDCRTTAAHKFRTWLGFRKNHVVLIQEKSVLTKTMSSFERKNIYKQYNVLIYSIGSYVWDYKLTVEIDENGQSNRNIDNKI